MELWFILAVASAIFGGANAFMHKVIVERGLEVYSVTFLGVAFSALVLFLAVAIFGSWDHALHISLLFALLGGTFFSLTLILKVDALRFIDSAIFFPIYKVAGPILVIAGGVFFFGETFSTIEWFGLAVSILVPIMLITKSENIRQKNLLKGILLLLVCAFVAAVSAILSKQGTNSTPNILIYIAAGELFVATGAFFLLLKRWGRESVRQMKLTIQNARAFRIVAWIAILNSFSAAAGVSALYFDGPLGIVYTIGSLYTLIPIILSIIYYHEHWSVRKITAIILSLAAIAFLQ